MLGNLLSYSGIITKTKAMEAHLIHPEEYETIASLGSVAEFINFLKNHAAYEDLFLNYNEHSLHRNQIEQIITNSLYLDYARLFRFANKEQRIGLRIIFFRYEINILKTCLRNLYAPDIVLNLSLFEPFFTKHSSFQLIALAESKNIDEFISHLNNTEYYGLFQKVRQTTPGDLVNYEVQLDIFYYNTIWKQRKKFSKGVEQKAFTDILGKQIDLLNIIWIYRSKKYFDMDTSQIYASIIPIHHKLHSAELMHLIESGSLEEFITTLDTTYYCRKKFDTDETKDTSTFTQEEIYQKVLLKLYHSSMKKYPYSICTLYYFLHMKELEIDHLTTALECVRYGLETSDTLKYILK